MKKTTIQVLSILTLVFLLTGCKSVSDEFTKLGDDVSNSYNNVVKKTEEIKKGITDTTDKIVETKKDIENAKKAVDEVFK